MNIFWSWWRFAAQNHRFDACNAGKLAQRHCSHRIYSRLMAPAFTTGFVISCGCPGCFQLVAGQYWRYSWHCEFRICWKHHPESSDLHWFQQEYWRVPSMLMVRSLEVWGYPRIPYEPRGVEKFSCLPPTPTGSSRLIANNQPNPTQPTQASQPAFWSLAPA